MSALLGVVAAVGCVNSEAAPSSDRSAAAPAAVSKRAVVPAAPVRTLAACGITTLDVRESGATAQGNAKSCELGLRTGPSLRLGLNRDDLSIMEPHLVRNEGAVRVYEGVGTMPGKPLYAAVVDVGGYTCSVNGLSSADAAVTAVKSCSNVFAPASEGAAR
jgi:hypothetical protein